MQHAYCTLCTLCPEKRDQNVFVISPTKLGQLWWNFVRGFPNQFSTKSCKCFPPHLNNVLKSSSRMPVKETPEFNPSQLWPPNSPDLSPVDYSVWEYCKRRCTKHASLIWMNWNIDWEWSGPIKQDACRHCGSHSPVASSIAADQWCMFYIPRLQYFPHGVINWIQIWRVWMPQLRWDTFWSFLLWQCSSSTSVMNISSFTR